MKKTKTRILVTGGAGFIGAHLTEKLIKNGHQVLVVDTLMKQGGIPFINKKSKFIKGDIRNKNSLDRALKKTDAVVHLAYINGTKHFYNMPIKILDIAVKGIINVLELCIKNKIKELYLASTAEVFQTAIKVPTKEDEPLKIPDVHNPRYSYACGKILHEVMGIHYGKKYFKKLVIFRPYNIYGEKMGKDHVVPDLIEKLKKLKGKKLKIQGTGNEIRSFCHIDDFIRGFDVLIKRGKHLNIYNIGSSQKVKIKDLALKMAKIYNKKIILVKSPISKGSTKIRVPDITKLKKLGFKPKLNIDKGLRKAMN